MKRVLIFTKDSIDNKGLNYGLGTAITKIYNNLDNDNFQVKIVTVINDTKFMEILKPLLGSFDILHSHDVYVNSEKDQQLLLETKIKYNFTWIHSYHGDFFSRGFYNYSFNYHEIPNINYYPLRYADTIVFYSRWLKEYFIKHYKENDAVSNYKLENSFVIPLGVDKNIFKPVKVNKKEILTKYMCEEFYEENKNKNIILFSGRPTLQKGVDYFSLLADLKYVKDNVLLIWVGDFHMNSTEPYFKPVLRSKILIIPKVSQEELNELYNITDVFYNPSIHEPFGLSTLEAMASKHPIVIGNENVAVLDENELSENLNGLFPILYRVKEILSMNKDEKQKYYDKYEKITEYYNWDFSQFLTRILYNKCFPVNIDSYNLEREEDINKFIYIGKEHEETDFDSEIFKTKHIYDKYKYLIELCNLNTTHSVLEIAGGKESKKEINKYTKNYTTFNLFESLEITNIFDEKIKTNNLLKTPYIKENQYDLLTATEVLEHSTYSYIMFKIMCILSKKNILITYPNNLPTSNHFKNDIDINILKLISKEFGFNVKKMYLIPYSFNENVLQTMILFEREKNESSI